jgi:cardiolipin synthase
MVKITKQNIPTLLSLSRVAIILIMMLSWVFVHIVTLPIIHWVMLVLFVYGAASDYLDGYLARKWNATSELGAMLDQITDKLLVTTVLMFLVLSQFLGIIPALIIVLREIYVSGLREYMALKNIAVPVSKLGKWKTAVQMLGITLVLFGICIQHNLLLKIGNGMVMLAAILALVSAWQYSRGLWKR